MTPEGESYVQLAERDLRKAKRLLALKEDLFHADVCGHSQQIVEKYLKAWLCERNLNFPTTHRLTDLLDLLLPLEPLWDPLRKPLLGLSRYATVSRYAHEEISREEAKAALTLARGVRKLIRERLGLSKN